MRPVILGKRGSQAARLDLLKLVDTRLLVQAASGGGKSWLLRKICELAADRVQILVLDPEGEFSTLREKHDFLLVGEEGELRPEVRTSALLARKLLQLRVSAVLDLYELRLEDRRRFVGSFLSSLMNVPKKLWHDVLVIVDEAHVFSPEKGKVAASSEAVIQLMTQGRKRGLCGVLATQRLSSLNKDAAAMAKNVLIGSTTLDVDLQRASLTLGLGGKDRTKLMHLEPGQFYGFGPAFDFRGVEMLRVGAVQTTHPRPGRRRQLTVPAPSRAIRGVQKEFDDLPDEAEKEIRDMRQAKAKIGELEGQLRMLRRQLESGKSAGAAGAEQRAEQLQGQLQEAQIALDGYQMQADAAMSQMVEFVQDVVRRVQKAVEALQLPEAPKFSLPVAKPARARQTQPTGKLVAPAPETDAPAPIKGGLRLQVLKALRWWEAAGIGTPTRQQVAAVAGSTGSGHFQNVLGQLRTAGLIDYPSPGQLMLLSAGEQEVSPVPRPPTLDTLCNLVRRTVLGNGLESRVFNAVVQHRGEPLPRGNLAEHAGSTGSGHFQNVLGRLRTLGLVDYPSPNHVGIGPVLKPFVEET